MTRARIAACVAAALALAACSGPPELVAPEPGLERMIVQPRGAPYREGSDGLALMRAPPAGTVARDGDAVDLPLAALERADTRSGDAGMAQLERGRALFAVVCANCHGLLGDGETPVAAHMEAVRPRNLQTAAIRAYPATRIAQVIADGYGLMPSQAELLPERDRQAVAAFVKALQLSQHAVVDELPPAQRRRAREQLAKVQLP